MPLSRIALLLSLLLAPCAFAEEKSLFNGKNVDGWEGDLKEWRVVDGVITCGSVDVKFPHNDFLVTTKSFQNFDLRLKVKLTGTEGFVNSGVQFRSVRVPKSFEMSGFQADIGAGYWGFLYDESRRNTFIAKPADVPAVKALVKNNDWNDYRVRAEGPHIEIWLNGTKTIDYTETDPNAAMDGFIGLQIHGNGKTQVQFKDIFITELPPTPDAPTWEKLGGYKPWPKKQPATRPSNPSAAPAKN